MERAPLLGHRFSVTCPVPERSLFVFVAITCFAACSAEHPDYEILFGHQGTPLAQGDKAAVFSEVESWFPLSGDATYFEDPNCGDVTPTAEVADLNRDGSYEVFVQWGNTCTSGMAGRSLSLFVKDAAGQYQSQFGFPAIGWTALDSATQGWPDLRFGGPGFCHPIWAWESGAYEFKCNLPETTGGCESRGKTC